MIVVKVELWPFGDEDKARLLGVLMIANDGTGDNKKASYEVQASHAGKYFGKRKEPYKTGRVEGFLRSLSPYRLIFRALKALGEI
jgi:hypothetical protein